MKSIQKDELFENIGQFLKTKGIELQQGSYTQKIRKSCTLMTDAINLSQQGLERAKTGIDRKLDQIRQVIHEKTAPKTPPAPGATPQPPPQAAASPQSNPEPAAPSGPAPKKSRPRRKKTSPKQ